MKIFAIILISLLIGSGIGALAAEANLKPTAAVITDCGVRVECWNGSKYFVEFEGGRAI